MSGGEVRIIVLLLVALPVYNLALARSPVASPFLCGQVEFRSIRPVWQVEILVVYCCHPDDKICDEADVIFEWITNFKTITNYRYIFIIALEIAIKWMLSVITIIIIVFYECFIFS